MDKMTNEEAIAIIRKEYLCVDRDCDIERSCGKCDLAMPSKEPILQAYKLAIKALEQEPCEDCISRADAIEFFKDDDYVVNELKNLVSVMPKPNKWIPVSERLPEDHKDVLICLSSDQICIGCYNSHRLPFSNHAIGWGASYVHDWCSDDVIAWMPLPEPYKASPTGAESEKV